MGQNPYWPRPVSPLDQTLQARGEPLHTAPLSFRASLSSAREKHSRETMQDSLRTVVAQPPPNHMRRRLGRRGRWLGGGTRLFNPMIAAR
jgi:hypothetical protein